MQKWLVEEMKKRGWSQRELSRRSGLPQSTLSQAIRGKRKITPDVCTGIAQALGESPEYVMRLAGILPPASLEDDSTLQELIELVRHLSPENRQDVLEYIRFRLQQQHKP
jgi:transcriptional regulator with XRE-family HTH domain